MEIDIFNLAAVLIVSCYVLMHSIEVASFASRAAGKISKRLALGTTVHHSIYTGSRFFLVLMLPSLGFIVESGILLDTYLGIVIFCLISTTITTSLVVINFNKYQILFQKIFRTYIVSSLPMAFLKGFFKRREIYLETDDAMKLSFKNLPIKEFTLSFLAYIFLVNGFFIAFYLSIIYSDYRLTMSQFTAAFHGVGAVVLSFYLDPMLSRSIDKDNVNGNWQNNMFSILVGRIFAYLFSAVIFIIILLVS